MSKEAIAEIQLAKARAPLRGYRLEALKYNCICKIQITIYPYSLSPMNNFFKSFLLALAIAMTIIFVSNSNAADADLGSNYSKTPSYKQTPEQIKFTAQNWVTYVGIRPWDSTFKITGMYGPQGNYSSAKWTISFFKYEDVWADTHTTEAQSLVCKVNTDIQKQLTDKLETFKVLTKAERCPQDPNAIIKMAQEIAALTNQLYSYQKEVTISTKQTPRVTIKEWQIVVLQITNTIVKEVFRTILPSTGAWR